MDDYHRYTSEKCVYTIVSYDVIVDAFDNRGSTTFIENSRWTTAHAQLQDANENESIYLVLLADAAKLTGIKWIAKIKEIELLPDDKTKITIDGLINLGLPKPYSLLTLQNGGMAADDDFSMSYALCATPEFAEEEIELTIDFLEDVENFKVALIKIEHQINPGQWKMLIGHYSAPNMRLSVGQLAEIAGYDGEKSGSLQYGKLARLISEAKNEEPPTDDQISAIASWINTKDEEGDGQWELYGEVAQALEELSWVAPSMRNSFSAADEVDCDATLIDEIDDFYSRVVNALNDSPIERAKRLATANQIPEKIVVITSDYNRNPDVVAEVLHRAKGICELCGLPAPFNRKIDNSPYLEVHHRIRLADGGLDCVENAIALCPNCHRESHYGSDIGNIFSPLCFDVLKNYW